MFSAIPLLRRIRQGAVSVGQLIGSAVRSLQIRPELLVLLIFTLAFGMVGQPLAAQTKLNLRSGGFSDRDLLGLGKPADRLFDRAPSANVPAVPDTLRILAIRVEFQEDNNGLTTGSGKFELSSTSDRFIDPPPHNRSYFEQQLTALSNYFKAVSHGRLMIEGDVFPPEENSSYAVSEQMNFYVPPNDEPLLDQRLSELLQQGFQTADAADAIVFSDYDVFILFHAGVGGDFSFDFDPTPQDVPSVFLSFETLREKLGNGDQTFQGIAVNGGQFFIRDGIILPETQTQEGIELGLLGTMAIMFGNQLGLPILFSPDTGLSGIGVFGLMDQGSGNFFGLIPAEPSAWSKVFLGWDTPIEVVSGTNLEVAASQARNQNKIYKVPINSHEYFLIENRDRDLNKDSLAVGLTGDGGRVEFRWDSNGQEVLLERPGVVTQVSEYDFGIPNTGILIWHIDDRIIAANLAANRVNADPLNRGVDLEEADGAQDIGQVYGILDPGAGAENGVFEDMFWGSNAINMLVNDSSDAVVFGPMTRPHSRANSGANSHVKLFDFSERDSVMTFSVRNDISQAGFPQFSGAEDLNRNSVFLVDLDGDGLQEIVASSESSGDIFAWKSNGRKVISNIDSADLPGTDGVSRRVPVATFAHVPGDRLFVPAAVKLGPGHGIVAATDRVVEVFLPQDSDNNGRADSLFVYQSSAAVTTAPLVLDDGPVGVFRVVIGVDTGALVAVDQDANAITLAASTAGAIAGLAQLNSNEIVYSTRNGQLGRVDLNAGVTVWQSNSMGTFSVGPVVADLDQDNNPEIIAVTNEGEIQVLTVDGGPQNGYPRQANLSGVSPVAVGDIDGDRRLDIVLVSGNQLFAFNQFGSLKNNFPVSLGDGLGSRNTSPVLADMNSDGIADVLVALSTNQLGAFTAAGKTVEGFPLSTGQPVNSAPFVADIDADGDVDLAATAEDGFVSVWDFGASFSENGSPWTGLFGDIAHSNANLQQQEPVVSSGQLLPPNMVYNYPNPTAGNQTTIRYTLNAAAQVRIKIYDLAGDFVDELVGPGFGSAENEVDWRLENIESGVYLAKVEAAGQGGSEVAIIKIAVVK